MHAGKNIVIVLALVAAGFFAAWLRFRPYLGSEGRYTDGVRTYDVSDAGEVRYAVWDRPEPLPGEVNSGENERRPALSPDGRIMVFVVGERGLGADLYVAEMEDGVARDPRPLEILNSVADEWSPSFGPGGLYFASDRPGTAGGLDLWRAPYALGTMGEPERLQGGINSSADDTDPAPIPGSDAIVFASNRTHQRQFDHDLYVARPRAPGAPGPTETDAAERPEAEKGLWEVEALLALNSPFDEREPAFTADGRNLFFASDRTGGYGDFDLYRSAFGAAGWVPPEVLAGVNSDRAERDPLPSRDGFELLFTTVEPGVPGGAGAAGSDVRRARSLELFRTPGRPVGWKDLLILAILLVLAILAWLAKQWEQLEVLYKCVLISLVVHLLLMWWFRDVYPEGGEYELRGGDSDRIRVRLVSNPTGAAQANAERGGELEVARAESEPTGVERRAVETAETAAAAAPSAARLERARAEAVAAPARAAVQPPERASEPSAAAPAVRQDEADFQRMEQGVQALTVAEPRRAAPAERAESDARQARLDSLPDAARESSPQAPRALPQERAAAGAALPDAPTARAVRHAPERAADSPAEATRVAQPREAVERRAQAAPELALQAGPAARRTERGTPEALRAPELEEELPDALRASGASAAERSALVVEGATDAPDEPAARSDARFERTAGAAAAPPALAEMTSETFERLREDRRAEESLLADAPAESTRPAARDTEIEIDRAAAAPTRRAESLDVAPRRFEALERSTPRDAPAPAPFRAAQVTPEARRDSPAVALAQVAEDVQPLRGDDVTERNAEVESGIERELSDSLLALESGAREREDRAAGPRRFERSAPRELDSPAPSFRPLATGERAEEDAALAVTRWEHTPYQSRSGEQKARAIDLHGGSEATEAAVAAGLRYLASRQRAEGNFGRLSDRHDKYHYVTVGKTGLALLAFMGAGHTQDSDTEHSPVVKRAVAFLLAMQDEDSGHFGYSSSYSHAIATYALAECYALTGDEHLRAPIERAVAHILRNQTRSGDPRFDGGWGYYFPDGKTLDRWPRASVTAWQVMALESARLGGLSVPGRAFTAAHDFLVRCWDAERGAFRYSHDPDRLSGDYPVLPGSTPASMFALSLLGEDIAGRAFRPGRSFLLERTPRVYRYTSDDDFVFRAVGNLYFWYYSTLALFRVGGRPWEAWNEGMKGALLPAQEDDGSWRPISIYAIDYAYDREGDRVYTTAMCVLTLEVYYRYFTPLLKVD